MKKNTKKILYIVISIGVCSFFIAVFFEPILSVFERAYVKVTCSGPNKEYTTTGPKSEPFCANVFSDGGKSCDSGNECLSGICFLPYRKERELVNKQAGQDTLIIPPKSGICKGDDVSECYSLGGLKYIENGKVAGEFMTCD